MIIRRKLVFREATQPLKDSLLISDRQTDRQTLTMDKWTYGQSNR